MPASVATALTGRPERVSPPDEDCEPHGLCHQEQLTPDKRLVGYLLRAKLPAEMRVKGLGEATSVRTADDAIRIAKGLMPAMFIVKTGTPLTRVVGTSGRAEFGLPDLDVAFGEFNATLSAGVWRVIRVPDPSRSAAEQTCFADISASSGRIIRYGQLPPPPTSAPRPVRHAPGERRRRTRRPWWKFWT
jgi:hypothetical protein